MGQRRTLIAAASVFLAAVAGIAVYVYAQGADKRAQDQVALVEAFIAAGDIPKGMTGDAALDQGLIMPSKVLRGSVPPAAVTDAGTLRGKVAAATIQTRQYITIASFVAPSQGGGGSLATVIGDRDLVAVTIAVDAERGVARQIAPGDRVDIAVVEEDSATYLLRNVKVLAVGAETPATAAGGNGQPSVIAAESGLITFELSPEDALLVVSANNGGGLYLTLLPLGASGATSSVPASGGR